MIALIVGFLSVEGHLVDMREHWYHRVAFPRVFSCFTLVSSGRILPVLILLRRNIQSGSHVITTGLMKLVARPLRFNQE